MPEISSIFVLPAAPAAPNAGGAPAGAPATPDRGAVAADFLSQFKAAIKNLASVALPQVATPALPALVSQPETPQAPPTDAKSADVKQSELMPEILATLGFVVVPPAIQLPTPAQPAVSDGGSQTIAVAVTASAAQPVQPALESPGSPQSLPASQAAQVPEAAQAAEPAQVPQSAQVAQSDQVPPSTQAPQVSQSPHSVQQQVVTTTPLPVEPQPAPALRLDTLPQLQTPLTAAQIAVPERPAPAAAPKAEATPAIAAVTSQTTPVDPAPITVVAQTPVGPDAPAAQHPATAPMVDSATPVVATQPGSTFQQSGFDGNSRQPHSGPVVESVSGTTPPQTAPEATFAAAAAVATQAAAPLPPDVRPSEVVNQIAHQADLYRVPGDRSVRIQLHPEGLGGVDVTLRYSAANGIQLHLNVEHASTGALVQAGWTELRDALATQGIHSDRLVMSISAPANASGLDFSNGNGSNRSDGGLSSFTQGQTSQQRQETHDQRTARGWNPAIDPNLPSSVDASPRVAPASAGHIDYRA